MRMYEAPPSAGLPIKFTDLLVRPTQNLALRSAHFLGIDEALSACSGTACLVIALQTLMQTSQRRVVIVPAFTCPLVAHAVIHCGLQLQICDLAPDCMDFDDVMLRQLVNHETLAIIATHLAGRVLDLAPILSIASAAGAHVIEDAATAFGATIAGETVGLQGSFGFFSFAVGKGLSSYEGGLLISKSPALLARAKAWSEKNIPARAGLELLLAVQLFALQIVYRPSLLPLCYRWPRLRAMRRGDTLAAMGDHFEGPLPLHTLGAWRQAVASQSMLRLRGYQLDCERQARVRVGQLQRWPGVKVILDASDACGVWPLLWVVLPSAVVCTAIFEALWPQPFGVARLYVRALTDYELPEVSLSDRSCATAQKAVPNARRLAACSLTISNSLWLSDAHFEQIMAVFSKHLPAPPAAECLAHRAASATAAAELGRVVAVDPGHSANV